MKVLRSLLAILVLAVVPAHADESPSLEDAFGLDLAVPESPAFDVLDLTPETITRPASPREFAAALLDGVDRNGNFQTGLAIDTVPYLVTPLSNGVTLGMYRGESGDPNDPTATARFSIYRFLSRIGLSVATVKGTDSNDEAWRVSAGLNVTPYDAGDPRLDRTLQARLRELERAAINAMATKSDQMEDHIAKLPSSIGDSVLGVVAPNPQPATKEEWDAHVESVDDRLQDIVDTHSRAMTPAELAALQSQIEQIRKDFHDQNLAHANEMSGYEVAAKKAQEEAKKRNWKASSWQLGAAARWLSEGGAIDELEGDGGAFWTSLALGTEEAPAKGADTVAWLKDSSQLIFHLRGRLDADVPDPANSGQFRSQDDVLAGLRLRVGVEWLACNFSGGFLYVNPEQGSSEELARYSVGLNVRIAEGWWVELVGGGQSGASDAEDQAFVLSSVKFALPNGRDFELPGL